MINIEKVSTIEHVEIALELYKKFPARNAQHNHTMGTRAKTDEEFKRFVQLLSKFSTTPPVGMFLIKKNNECVGSIEVSPVIDEHGYIEPGIFMCEGVRGVASLATQLLLDNYVTPYINKTLPFCNGKTLLQANFQGLQFRVQPTNKNSLALCARLGFQICDYEKGQKENDHLIFYYPTRTPLFKESGAVQELIQNLLASDNQQRLEQMPQLHKMWESLPEKKREDQ